MAHPLVTLTTPHTSGTDAHTEILVVISEVACSVPNWACKRDNVHCNTLYHKCIVAKGYLVSILYGSTIPLVAR